jgi:hypothetical protein
MKGITCRHTLIATTTVTAECECTCMRVSVQMCAFFRRPTISTNTHLESRLSLLNPLSQTTTSTTTIVSSTLKNGVHYSFRTRITFLPMCLPQYKSVLQHAQKPCSFCFELLLGGKKKICVVVHAVLYRVIKNDVVGWCKWAKEGGVNPAAPTLCPWFFFFF